MHATRWIAGAAIVLAARSETGAFDGPGRTKVAVDALRLAPPALARQVRKHREALGKGAAVAPPSTLEEAKRSLQADFESAVAMINGHKSFTKVSEVLGRIAGTMTVLNNPLWGDPARDDRKGRSD